MKSSLHLYKETTSIEATANSEAEQQLAEGRAVLRHAADVFGPEAGREEGARFDTGLAALEYGDIVECGADRWRMELSFRVPEASAEVLIRQGAEVVTAAGYEPAENNPASASSANQLFVVGGRAPDGRRLSLGNSSGHPRLFWAGVCTDDPSMAELGERKRNGPGPSSSAPESRPASVRRP